MPDLVILCGRSCLVDRRPCVERNAARPERWDHGCAARERGWVTLSECPLWNTRLWFTEWRRAPAGARRHRHQRGLDVEITALLSIWMPSHEHPGGWWSPSVILVDSCAAHRTRAGRTPRQPPPQHDRIDARAVPIA